MCESMRWFSLDERTLPDTRAVRPSNRLDLGCGSTTIDVLSSTEQGVESCLDRPLDRGVKGNKGVSVELVRYLLSRRVGDL